jgi:hypothetical protein
MKNAGEYGGRVLRGFKGDGIGWIAGAIITPEVASRFPLTNRMALHTQGFVEWFAQPDVKEVEAREAGSPAPERPSRAKVGAKDKAPSTPRRVRQ